ncbi:MAG TPA: hypothetical protein DCE52_13940 [Rhodobacteraceae bacterium]|nr:hypothetical protein [Paracoccaceae bacterium]
MSEILTLAKKAQNESNAQSESIKSSVSSGMKKLEQHLMKHIKESASTTRSAIAQQQKEIIKQNKLNHEQLQKASFKALPPFVMGVTVGASLVLLVLIIAQKFSIQV